MATLSETKDQIYGMLCADKIAGTPVPELTRTQRVYRGEPRAGDLVRPIAVTVGTAGWTGDEWRFVIRVYASIDSDPLQVQDDLDTTIQEVEWLLDQNGITEQADGEVVYAEQLNSLIASFKVRAGRGDGRD